MPWGEKGHSWAMSSGRPPASGGTGGARASRCPAARSPCGARDTLEDPRMLSTDFVPGAPVWIDLGSHDIPATAAYYGAVFGWEFQSAGPEAEGYGLFLADGKQVGAV